MNTYHIVYSGSQVAAIDAHSAELALDAYLERTGYDDDGHYEVVPEWSGSLCPIDPDNFWIDDETGERVCATTGARTPPAIKGRG